MWRLGLAQTRAGWRRLIAAGTAVALGALFVATIMLTSGVFRSAALATARASMYGADFELTTVRAIAHDSDVENLEHATGHYIRNTLGGGLLHEDRRSAVELTTQPPPSFSVQPLLDGTRAAGPEEVVISETLAQRLRVEVGESVEVLSLSWDEVTFESILVPSGRHLTVSGISAGSEGEMWGLFEAYLTPEGLAGAPGEHTVDMLYTSQIYLTTDEPAAMADELATTGWVSSSLGATEKAEGVFQQYTGMTNPITTLSVLFSIIALAVAGLVVGNTLQVLVTQRATLIGILRSVGATRGQIRSAVVLEATVIGAVGGLAGTALAHSLVTLALEVLNRTSTGASWQLPGEFRPLTFVVPVAVAIAVTVVSSVLPARAASRVRPLAAVRRFTSPRVRPSPIAYLLGVLLLLLGLTTTLVALAVRSTFGWMMEVDTSALLVLGALGVGIFGVGLLTISPIFFPWIATAVGTVLQRIAPKSLRSPVRLARTNLRSNVRRTTATSNALLVGVSLVTLLVTGAASSRASLTAVAAGMQPTDLIVATVNPYGASIPRETVQEISEIEGVAAVAPIRSVGISIGPSDGTYQMESELLVADPTTLQAVSYSEGLLTSSDDGAIVVDPSWGLNTGTVTVRSLPGFPLVEPGPLAAMENTLEGGQDFAVEEYSPEAPVLTLNVVNRAAPVGSMMATTETAESLGIDATSPPTQLWVKTDPGMVAEVSRAVAAALPAGEDISPDSYYISNPGEFRERIDNAISTVVTTVAGLLAISIIIALVGVANTLSLSVFERRREIALLRSVGLTRFQLRASLAVEGVIITSVATIVGVVVGGALGVAGASALFSGTAGTKVVFPWATIGIIVLVALVAGPLASALPARQALRAAPVASLHDD